ncbi:hypothetical protein [Pontivivens insulae]|uniref:Flp pilus assembly protein, pilin Flp n=1 Tax=Pontivivens insulae TaxID=1639689 RepID=A0A2R8A8R2_9RHOB|nr:hypothetical protein [Pontivivens insulae]RED18718.1 hypothetical protein DFR53_0917 [Pontivivens insulae]SPF28616.1 hypothetical protein POI8812_00918 [Pontivivens insulae]
MFKFIEKFQKDESGAVTVDWVVLAGAVVALAVGVVATIETSLEGAASNIDSQLDSVITGSAITDVDTN